jgi:pilus assembly protein CpaB
MNSNAIRVVAGVLVVLAILMAIVAFNMHRRLASDAIQAKEASAQPQNSVPQTLVVVAVKPLLVDKPIGRDSVALVPVQVAPTEYYTNVDDVVNKTPLIDIDSGTPVTPRFFKHLNILARAIPPGHLALSLKVDDVVGTGGFVRPGDFVDVLLYIKSVTDTPTGEPSKDKSKIAGGSSGEKTDIATQARLLLKNTLVLSYEDHLVDAPKVDDRDKDKQAAAAQQQRRERTAVIAVPEADVTRVMLGANLGDIRLALHPQNSDLEAAAATPPAGIAPTPNATVTAAAPPASSQAAVSAMPAPDAGETVTASALPLSDAEKAKIEAAKVPDMAITAAELAKVQLPPDVEKKRKTAVARPRIEIYRGSAHEQSVYP